MPAIADDRPWGPDVTLDEPAFIHPTALIYGKVYIGPDASLWPHAVIRSESSEVRVGRCANIQDFAMIHAGFDHPVIIGEHCTITHHCTLHGCHIEDACLLGINCTIMDGCRVGEGSIVAGGSFLTEGTQVPPNSIVMGTPAKVVKERDNREANIMNALIYQRNAEAYARGDHRSWQGPEYQEFKARELARLRGE